MPDINELGRMTDDELARHEANCMPGSINRPVYDAELNRRQRIATRRATVAQELAAKTQIGAALVAVLALGVSAYSAWVSSRAADAAMGQLAIQQQQYHDVLDARLKKLQADNDRMEARIMRGR